MYDIIVVIELPFEEVFFVDTNKLTNGVGKEYLQVLTEAIEREEDLITIPSEIAFSSGGLNHMRDALVEPPCFVSNYIVVEVENGAEGI